MKLLQSLTTQELYALNNEQLCARMEEVLNKIQEETYSPESLDQLKAFPQRQINDFFQSFIIKSLSDEHQRKALQKCFEFLIEIEYCFRLSSWVNNIIFGTDYHEINSWKSPRHQIINSAADHFTIAACGAAIERFMDLIYIVETGKPVIPLQKSKFKAFRKWLLNSSNRFVFISPILSYINKFREEFRTAELHKWSKLPNRLLRLERPTHQESNDHLQILNMMTNVWYPIIDLLNERTPTSTLGSCGDIEWLKAFNENDSTKIQLKIKQIEIELTKSE